MEKQFKINEFLTLKLEGSKTQIYVGGKRFMHCKELMLNIPVDGIKRFNKVDSIDDAEQLYKMIARDNLIYDKGAPRKSIPANIFNLTPEQEFQGHCSNLQAWAEHDYDTRILHSNLAFPLLYELAKFEDPQAIKVFKKEILCRFKSGNENIREFLISEGYLASLNSEELFSLLDLTQSNVLKKFEKFMNQRFMIVTDLDDFHCPIFWCNIKHPNLRVIGISINNTELSEIPDDITELKWLEYLYLDDNNLKSVPKNIYALKNLIYINLSGNDLLKLPKNSIAPENLTVIF